MSLDTNLQSAFTAVGNAIKSKVSVSQLGVANGVATLDSGGKIPSGQLPSYVDDVVEYSSLEVFPATGVTGVLYIALDTNKEYRWGGTVYSQITSGAVDSVSGKTGVVTLVKGDVGLNLVDNTADSSKSVLSATKLSTGRNITVGSTSKVFDGSSDVSWSLAEIGATNYVHPSGDGYLHVPATGTTNSGKVLTAGATPGSFSWTTISVSEVTSVASRTGDVVLGIGDITSLQTTLDGKATTGSVTTLSNNVGATDTDYVAVFNAALV